MKFSIIFLLLFISCNLDVNTVDTQASETISKSKRNALFLKQYKALPQTSCNVKEAWVEYAWKNELENGKVNKRKLNEYQLVISLDLDKVHVNKSDYLINWELSEKNFGTLGSANGVYILRLKNKELPSNFTIALNQKDRTRGVCNIVLNDQMDL